MAQGTDVSVDPRWRSNQRVYEAASGSANELVPALEEIITSGDWREFVHPMRGPQRFNTFAAYCSEFLGLSAEAVEALLDKTNFKAAAREVRRMLAEDVQPVAGVGRPSAGNVRDTNITERQDDSTYVLARLKRDDPALAQEVIEGAISANAAAIRAGIRHRYVRVRPDDVDQAVSVLLKHYSPDDVAAALERIAGKVTA